MDVPGLSLFQGAESLQLNTSTQQRIEEQDAFEDQQRRNEELKNELQNAFDDLDDEYDDDEDASECHNTIDSTSTYNRKPRFQNGFGNGKRSPAPQFNQNNDVENELRRMKNVIDSKSEELKNIITLNANERVKYESQMDELKKRLAIAEAEKERAHMSRKQTHELVVESKQKLAEREEQILELNAKIKLLDARNLELVTELEHTKSLLSDTQHKYHMVERNANLSSDKHTDAIVKQLNERYAAQTDMMQQQINTMRAKLEEKDNDLKRLQIQNAELHKSRESMLIDKSDTINQLTQKLEVSQRQCQNFILKNSGDSELVQENVKLMRTVSALEQHTEDMQKTIDGLTARLDSTTAELEQMTDSAICDEIATNGLTGTPLSRNTDTKLMQSSRIGMGTASRSTPLSVVEERLMRLKQEFNRCMTDQKAKRQEIVLLKERLAEQTAEIDRMRTDENRALIEMNTNREKIERLTNKLRMAQSELDELRAAGAATTDAANTDKTSLRQSAMSRFTELERQLHLLQKENENFRQNCDHLHATIQELEDERDRIEEQCHTALGDRDGLQIKFDAIEKEHQEQQTMVRHLEMTLQLREQKCEELMRILDREQIDYDKSIQHLPAKHDQDKNATDLKSQKDKTNACTKCIHLTTKIAQLGIEAVQAQTSCSNYLKEIHDLKRSLKHANNCIAELQAQMQMKREHDQMIIDLKKKAEQFEEFLRNQSPTRHDALNVISERNARDQCVSTDDDLLTYELPRSGSGASVNSNDRSVERRMREEMARAMAVQIKTVENHYKENKHEQEEHIRQISLELSEMSKTLNARELDITKLKQCILSERVAFKEFLAEKDADTESKLKKQHNTMIAMHADLETAHKRIEYLTRELEDTSQQYQTERISASKLMNEWKSELDALIERESMLTQQIRKMENEHKAALQSLNEKYMAAKKTAANYKKYSDDKEEHIKRESERLKSAYEKHVRHVKENMEMAIKDNERKTNKRIAELQAKYENSNGKM